LPPSTILASPGYHRICSKSRGDPKNSGTLERAAQMANHASTRTTQLYDRRAEEVTLDEVERILV
jgi:hypothetical protein